MKTERSSAVPASARTPGRFDAAYRVLEDAIASKAFPGCAFGVFAEDRVVLQDALGRFTYEDKSPAVLANSVFDIASLTKVAATTAAAMLLWQRSWLDLETPLGEYLPGFVVGRDSGDKACQVTLRNVLAHNSGLPGYVEFFKTAKTPTSLFRACLQLPLEAEPGTRAEYSDPGFILLGKALTVALGQPLNQWVRREVYGALGMTATGFCPARAARSKIPPTEEDTWFRMRTIQGEAQDENAWVLKGVAGHAGLFSNVPDLLRFAKEILRAGIAAQTGERKPLFTRETVEHFATRQPPAGSSQAIGWDTPSKNSSAGKYFSQHSIGHLGYSGCSLWIDLDARVAVVLLTNRTWPDRQSQLIKVVRPIFHDAIREALQK